METKVKYFFNDNIIGELSFKFNKKLNVYVAVMSFNIPRYSVNHRLPKIEALMIQADAYCNKLIWDFPCILNPVYKLQKDSERINMSHHAIEACGYNTSVNTLSDFKKLIDMVESAQQTASKNTHYHKINEWADPLNDFIHNKLRQKIDYDFWKCIYSVLNSINYSPNLITVVANHHSSASERNIALLTELQFIMKNKNND